MEVTQPVSLEERKANCKPLVLVVDDDETHLKLLNLLSDRLGIAAHTASSCAQAMEALRMFSFDVVLMDYRMPEVDGCGCAQQIRSMKELRSNIPIIAVTAHGSQENRQRCFEAGMDDFLEKPFTFEELHEKLCYWLRTKTPEDTSVRPCD